MQPHSRTLCKTMTHKQPALYGCWCRKKAMTYWVPGPLPFLKLPSPCQPKGLAMEAVKRLPSILPTEEVRLRGNENGALALGPFQAA